jgi:hypothetical protein
VAAVAATVPWPRRKLRLPERADTPARMIAR